MLCLSPQLQALRQTAAELLALTAQELFPGTILIQGGASSLGFSYELIFPFSLQEPMIPLLEEKMRAVVKEKRVLERLEMVPSNAAQFLAHHNQEVRAEEALESDEGLVTVVRIGDWINLCQPMTTSLDEVAAFSLSHAISSGEHGQIVEGFVFAEKEELKKFLKKQASYQEDLASDLRLYTYQEKEDCYLWLPKGEWLKQQLISLWQKEHSSFISMPPSVADRLSPLKALGGASYAELLIDSSEAFETIQDLAYFFGKKSELLKKGISSLQFLIKIIKLCGFEYQLVLKGSAFFKEIADQASLGYTQELSEGAPILEVRVQDALGREWTLSYLRLEREALVVSLFNRLERFIALLIEQKEGVPFWLAPEQVRLFSLGKDLDEYGELLLKRLQLEGFRVSLDCSGEKFSKRLYEALRERVPYTMVLGKREKETGLLTLRELSTREEKRLTVEELVKILSNRNCV